MAFRIRHLLRLLYFNFSTCESKKKLGVGIYCTLCTSIGDPYIPLVDMFFSNPPEQHILSSPFMEWRTIVCRSISSETFTY